MDKRSASPSDEDMRAELELARRLLEDMYPGGSMELRLGALPTLLPQDFPLPDRARIVGSMGRDGQFAQGIIEASQPVEDVRAFYAERLPMLGWKTDPFMRGGGFITGPARMMDRFVSREQGKMVALTYIERAEGGVTVRLMVMDAPPEDVMRRDEQHMRMSSSIPPLTAPQGATLYPGGGGGSSADSWWSHARMTASLDLNRVMAHFDRQLATGGWSRVEGGASSHVGWSLWSLEVGGRAYIGVFNAIQAPNQVDEFLLQARVESLTPSETGGAAWTSYGHITSRSERTSSVASQLSVRVEAQEKLDEASAGGDTQKTTDPTP